MCGSCGPQHALFSCSSGRQKLNALQRMAVGLDLALTSHVLLEKHTKQMFKREAVVKACQLRMMETYENVLFKFKM